MSVHLALEEEPPRTRRRDEDADLQRPGRGLGTRDLRAADAARAARRAGLAHVRVHVVERLRPEEDRVRERADHGVNFAGCPSGSVTVISRDAASTAVSVGGLFIVNV